jgi:HK97 family phage portal protein
MPVRCYRTTTDSGIDVEIPSMPVLLNPGGERVPMTEWLYASQVDLDRLGNAIGIITAVDANNKPARIELQDAASVSIRGSFSTISEYRIAGKTYTPDKIWHERQYVVPGLPVGLSPIAHAAYSVGTHITAQQFALNWFTNSGAPSGVLRNTSERTIKSSVAQVMKERFKLAVEGRDVFVTGSEWEYVPAAADAAAAAFLEQQKASIPDIARFLGVPADMIDAEVSTGSITYANVTQRNLQLLILNLGPAIYRREQAISSRMLPAPRFVRFDTEAALLRMDPATRTDVLVKEVGGRIKAPSEARAEKNLPPFTDEQLAEFDRLFPTRSATPPKPEQGAPA